MPPRKATKAGAPAPPKKAAAAKANQKSAAKKQAEAAPQAAKPAPANVATKSEPVDQKPPQVAEEKTPKEETPVLTEAKEVAAVEPAVSKAEQSPKPEVKTEASPDEGSDTARVPAEADKNVLAARENSCDGEKKDVEPDTSGQVLEVKVGEDVHMVEAKEEVELNQETGNGEVKDEEMQSVEEKATEVTEKEDKADEITAENATERTGEEGGEDSQLQKAMQISERRQRKKLEVFVGGLEKSATEEDLRNAFKEVGEITEIRLMKDLQQTGKNKGYAFVRYATAVEAKRAVTELANVKIRGKKCGVVPLEENDTIFLGNIDKTWKKDDIINKLKEAGIEHIENVTVIEDPHNSQLNRGFGFLELETYKDAQVAFRALQKKNVFGKDKAVKVSWAQPLNEPDEDVMAQVKSVFVDGLPSTWNEEQVKEQFGKFGDIEKVVLSRNMQSAKRKDFGFVNYTTREAAISCIETLSKADGLTDGDAKVKVKVSLAKPPQKGKTGKGDSKGINKGDSKGANKGGSQAHVPKSRYSNNVVGAVSGKGLLGRGGQTAPSTAAHELIQVLREQATWGQGHAAPSGGHSFNNYGRAHLGNMAFGDASMFGSSQLAGGYHGGFDQSLRFAQLQSGTAMQDLPSTGVKRGYSALGEDVYADSRGNPRARLDNSAVAGSSSVYGGLSQQQFYHNPGRPHPTGSASYASGGFQTHGSQRSSAQGGRKGGASGSRARN
uniref:TSA: Wollemia nobilis Ref_Wollemi_Transcript_12905_2951 transcribed RNA sequence n=1 Tax=Wollemia nobilis TaxID=56998 RepID=A0A0C9RL19_9CONI